MAIYTKTGDDGTTSLASGQRVSKTDLRLETYGTADELNSFVGLLRAQVAEMACGEEAKGEEAKGDKAKGEKAQGDEAKGDKAIDEQLDWVQILLFDLGAELSEAPGEWVTDEDAHRLEQWIDQMQAELEPLRSFILPGGNQPVAMAHVCRTVTRRLERRMIEMKAKKASIRTINRLSDYFFVLSRWLAKKAQITQNAWKNKKNV